MLELWVVRHGQTNWNLEHRVQGWTDIPLNAAGIEEAHALGQYLHGIPFLALYTSDLQRAHTTASILQGYTGIPIHVDERLREKRFGALEGQIRHQVQKQKVVRPHGVSPQVRSDDPEAESNDDLSKRILTFLNDLGNRHETGRVLIVTHGALIRALLDLSSYREAVSLRNTSVSRIRQHQSNLHAVHVNWADHLKQLGQNHPFQHGTYCAKL